MQDHNYPTFFLCFAQHTLHFDNYCVLTSHAQCLGNVDEDPYKEFTLGTSIPVSTCDVEVYHSPSAGEFIFYFR